MAMKEFSYGESMGKYYPIVPLHLKNNIIEIDSDALIDSGAVVSVFRSDIAELLDVKIEKGLRMNSIGIGGKVEVFVHELEIKLFDRWFTCKVAFSKQSTARFNLLGRDGFFERHLVTFNEKDKKTILTEF